MHILLLILFFLPVYVSNMIPVVLGGGITLDELFNAHIFGNHKTLRGLIAGIVGGILTGFLLGYFFGNIYVFTFIGFISGIGTMCGDLIGSFLKRRMEIKEGENSPFDSTVYILCPLLLFIIYFPNLLNLIDVLIIIILSILLHIITNRIAFWLKLKNVPW